jgi:hypothetical protein
MLFILLLIITAFLSLVAELNLVWVLEWLINQPPLYYHCVMIFMLTWKGLTLLERPYRLFRRCLVKLVDWIDHEEPRGGSQGPKGPGSSKRSYSTVASARGRPALAKSPKTEKPVNNNLPAKPVKVFAKFGRLPTYISENFNAMLGVKAQPSLRKLMQCIASVCKVSLIKSKVQSVRILTSRLVFLRRRMGLKGLTLYLKAAFVLYQQSLGGHVLKDTASVNKIRVSRNNSGLPKIIPRHLRYAIRKNSVGVMKLVSSLLNLYRDITFPGTPKLSTIVDATTGTFKEMPALYLYANAFVPLFTKGLSALDFMNGGRPLFIIWKAAPGMIKDFMFGVSNYSTHPHNILKSLLSLFNRPKLWDAFIDVLMITNNKHILALIDFATMQGLLIKHPRLKGALGKLHAKEEPAGKVRIFAIVDPWTQWALYPLHLFIFSCLAKIPQDGTFNQEAPLHLLLRKRHKELFSLDLTAATDRLPLMVQKMLLTLLVGEGFAEAWAILLVGRSYSFRQMGYSK